MITVRRDPVQCDFCDKHFIIALLAAWNVQGVTLLACDACDRKLKTVFPDAVQTHEHP